jgi:hypothetical protein
MVLQVMRCMVDQCFKLKATGLHGVIIDDNNLHEARSSEMLVTT